MASLVTAISSEAIISYTTSSCEVSSQLALNYGPFDNLWVIRTFSTVTSAIFDSNSSR